MSDSTAVVTSQSPEIVRAEESVFLDGSAFERAKEMAVELSDSTVIPASYQKNPANCLVALEYANRIGVSPIALMQNLHIIQGKPSLSGPFLLGVIRSRFTNVLHVWEGDKGTEGYGCRLLADHPETGDTLRGTLIDWRMVRGEGWLGRKDSKWKTMPEQMFKYRAATFWAREFIPHVMLGMHTDDELVEVRDRRTAPVNELNAELQVGRSNPEEPSAIDANESGGDQKGLPWENQ